MQLCLEMLFLSLSSIVTNISVFQSKSHMYLPVVMQLNNQALMLSSHWDECFSKFNISAAGSTIGECSFISKTSCSYITIILRILALKMHFKVWEVHRCLFSGTEILFGCIRSLQRGTISDTTMEQIIPHHAALATNLNSLTLHITKPRTLLSIRTPPTVKL